MGVRFFNRKKSIVFCQLSVEKEDNEKKTTADHCRKREIG